MKDIAKKKAEKPAEPAKAAKKVAAENVKKPAKAARTEKEGAAEKGMEDSFGVLRFVLMTEKAVQMIESQNKLVFIVDRRSGKKEIKQAAEAAFQSSVKHVNTMIDQLGRKKAFIKFREPGQAGEIAIRLGII